MHDHEANWQPIETAPKDGTPVLGWSQLERSLCICVYDGGIWVLVPEWRDAEEDVELVCQVFPTDWMPRPPPPEGG